MIFYAIIEIRVSLEEKGDFPPRKHDCCSLATQKTYK
jgi:hypothetical protein